MKKLTERERFERTMARQFLWCLPDTFEFDDDGLYRKDEIFYAWEGWQASARVKRTKEASR